MINSHLLVPTELLWNGWRKVESNHQCFIPVRGKIYSHAQHHHRCRPFIVEIHSASPPIRTGKSWFRRPACVQSREAKSFDTDFQSQGFISLRDNYNTFRQSFTRWHKFAANYLHLTMQISLYCCDFSLLFCDDSGADLFPVDDLPDVIEILFFVSLVIQRPCMFPPVD